GAKQLLSLQAFVFSHPDYTVGPGTSPGHAILSKRTARGLYRRSGIGKPCFPHLAPKTDIQLIMFYSNILFKKKTSFFVPTRKRKALSVLRFYHFDDFKSD